METRYVENGRGNSKKCPKTLPYKLYTMCRA